MISHTKIVGFDEVHSFGGPLYVRISRKESFLTHFWAVASVHSFNITYFILEYINPLNAFFSCSLIRSFSLPIIPLFPSKNKTTKNRAGLKETCSNLNLPWWTDVRERLWRPENSIKLFGTATLACASVRSRKGGVKNSFYGASSIWCLDFYWVDWRSALFTFRRSYSDFLRWIKS